MSRIHDPLEWAKTISDDEFEQQAIAFRLSFPSTPDRAKVEATLEVARQVGRLADAQERVAEATLLLARATAGEFDQEAEEPMTSTPKGKGMGMQG